MYFNADHKHYAITGRRSEAGGLQRRFKNVPVMMKQVSSPKPLIKELVVRREFPETWIWNEFENFKCVNHIL